jgi:hypothetical protein
LQTTPKKIKSIEKIITIKERVGRKKRSKPKKKEGKSS